MFICSSSGFPLKKAPSFLYLYIFLSRTQWSVLPSSFFIWVKYFFFVDLFNVYIRIYLILVFPSHLTIFREKKDPKEMMDLPAFLETRLVTFH